MAYVILEDGSAFEGRLFGAKKCAEGEVVFNTGMTGYQEVLTDPSYYGQMVVMTYPLVGNYGINIEESESYQPGTRALIVQEACLIPSNWRSQETLDEFMADRGIVGIQFIDTRALTKKIRSKGTMRGKIIDWEPTQADFDSLNEIGVKEPVASVTCKTSYTVAGRGMKVGVIDLGMKQSILNNLMRRDFNLTVYPAHTPAGKILKDGCESVVLSNGPGDPQDNPEVIETVRFLMERVPMFGICLGHQLMALAQGAMTERLAYGHRGANHPVKELSTGRVYITAQNHGYTVKPDTLPSHAHVSFINMNDGTVEGIEYSGLKAFSVQFHPEGAAGPTDTGFLFNRFLKMCESEVR